jgi:hypothetical protein
MSILKLQQERLWIELQQHRPRSTKTLELSDPFILTSSLQKALRRGDEQVATPAARALLGLEAARLEAANEWPIGVHHAAFGP